MKVQNLYKKCAGRETQRGYRKHIEQQKDTILNYVWTFLCLTFITLKLIVSSSIPQKKFNWKSLNTNNVHAKLSILETNCTIVSSEQMSSSLEGHKVFKSISLVHLSGNLSKDLFGSS